MESAEFRSNESTKPIKTSASIHTLMFIKPALECVKFDVCSCLYMCVSRTNFFCESVLFIFKNFLPESLTFTLTFLVSVVQIVVIVFSA